MFGNIKIHYRFFKKLVNRQVTINDQHFSTNEAICLQCDFGYIHLRKGLEKTHIEWTVSKEIPQMEWTDKFETHFEWKQSTQFTHLETKTRPMSITFILPHAGRLK